MDIKLNPMNQDFCYKFSGTCKFKIINDDFQDVQVYILGLREVQFIHVHCISLNRMMKVDTSV